VDGDGDRTEPELHVVENADDGWGVEADETKNGGISARTSTTRTAR
jgi:hypothetical protein